MNDTELRILAVDMAIQCEGPKAVTDEVLAAADDIYRFLKGETVTEQTDAPRPN